MQRSLIYLMVYCGSALMAFNIYKYVQFSRSVRQHGNWDSERRLFNVPIALLVLFLAGYLAVGLIGRPDMVIAAILLGGSVFVLVMLILIQRTVARIQENGRLEMKLAAAEEASKAKTFFLSNMSHDIRTPLNAIIGYTTLAGRARADEKQKYIDKIDAAGRHLQDIVGDVLEMSRIENGQVSLSPLPMDLEGCVRQAGDMVLGQLEQKRIALTVACDVTHRWVLCDRRHLDRALMNLLCNAGKFTGEGGRVGLSLRELGSDAEDIVFEIRVSDTGIGMSPDFVEHLFTPFEREQTSTISRIQGTGLGMAITKKIIDLMGGDIDVRTEKGQGTEFTIRLSLPPAEAPGEAEAAPAPAARLSGRRILLVEDNAVNLEIAQMLLAQAGFETESAENGKEAVERVAASRPGDFDAVLMDIQMPVMDGYQAARAIRALPDAALARIPIIAMTANAFEEDRRAAHEAGMDAHIAKPLDVQAMLRTLQEVLEKNETA